MGMLLTVDSYNFIKVPYSSPTDLILDGSLSTPVADWSIPSAASVSPSFGMQGSLLSG